MANQVVVSPLLELVSDKLADLIDKGFGVAWRVDDEMKKLSKTLSRIKYLVVDAEEKQVADFAIRDWLRDLKDAACTAEDVLEEWEYQGLAPETSHNNNFVDKVSNSLKELDGIANENSQLHLQKGALEKPDKIIQGRDTGSLLTEPVYGREEDKRILMTRLSVPDPSQHCHPSVGEGSSTNKIHISVCAILGLGGLGKTTLAKMVYKDEQVARHFEVRAWTCVSNDFDVNKIIRGIISSITKTACAIEELDPLQQGLQEKLRGQRFLIVLDDIWEENQDKWNEVMGTLACGAKGSCVIVTTRLEMVASITSTIPFHRLDRLSEDDCCALFKQRAFGLEEKKRPDLMKIGNEIVKKCKGVPLAAKALGASLRFKREPRQWLNVKDSEIWQLPENSILPALRLSYHHLPPQLRQCFAYCAIYKKDQKIDRKELIYLWMANGFVQSRGSMDRLEDVGNEIFQALLWRCFFQDITKGEDGDITTCKMHDLVHDLACDVAGNECSIVDGRSTKNITRRTRHLSQFHSTETRPLSVEFLANCPPSLRSLLIWNRVLFEESQLIFSHLICLRALDLSGTSTRVLSDNIGDMKHLRYLNLSSNPITSLPKSICKLINLETLNLRRCRELVILTKDMSEMRRLRHLDNGDCTKLTKMPIGMGKLTCLQTLSSFVVGLESEGGGGINELGGLNKIEGVLKISGLENVRNPMDAKEANLLQKENLCSLKLLWGYTYVKLTIDSDSDSATATAITTATATATEVMKGLQPPPNLRQFVVQGYNGVSFPSLLLPKLVKIKLSFCRRLKFIDEGGDSLRAGGFRSLEELELEFMSDLEGWSSLPSSSSSQTSGGEAADIPKRRLLTRAPPVTINSQSSLPFSSSFSSSHNQQAVEVAKQLFPCLKKLSLHNCPKLTSIPLPSSVESVNLSECNQSVLGQLNNLPQLSRLQICEFYELECFPLGMLLNLTALENLEIRDCPKVETLPEELMNLAALKKLKISRCSNVETLPEGLMNLIALEKLDISYCYNVEALPEGLMNLSSLRSLHIQGCHCLKQLPKMNQSRLFDLEISYCRELEFNMKEDFQNLVALQRLTLESLPKLAHFPEGIKQAMMLKRLSIIGCSEEEVMDLPEWIGTLTKLQRLKIEGCKNRKVLPEGMQHLTALRELEIVGCDAELERRCKKGNGEDWSKIAHVRSVRIDTGKGHALAVCYVYFDGHAHATNWNETLETPELKHCSHWSVLAMLMLLFAILKAMLMLPLVTKVFALALFGALILGLVAIREWTASL